MLSHRPQMALAKAMCYGVLCGVINRLLRGMFFSGKVGVYPWRGNFGKPLIVPCRYRPVRQRQA